MDEAEGLIQSLIQQVLQNQQEFSDEELERIFQVLQQAVEWLESRKQAPIESAIPQVPASEYPSSNVNGMKYDPDTGELLVQFHGPYPQAEGSIYKYSGIPKFIFDILQKGAIGPKTSGKNKYHEWIRGVTPSLGGTLNALIKAGGFDYQKVA